MSSECPCPACGGPVRPASSGGLLTCPTCATQFFATLPPVPALSIPAPPPARDFPVSAPYTPPPAPAAAGAPGAAAPLLAAAALTLGTLALPVSVACVDGRVGAVLAGIGLALALGTAVVSLANGRAASQALTGGAVCGSALFVALAIQQGRFDPRPAQTPAAALEVVTLRAEPDIGSAVQAPEPPAATPQPALPTARQPEPAPRPAEEQPKPAPVAANPPASLADLERQILELTNAERGKAGLQALTVQAKLTLAAQSHTSNMARQRKLDHVLDGQGPTERLAAVGYRGFPWGENVAAGYPDAAAVVRGWMNSPGHRANILKPAFREIGIGTATADDGTPYYTQVFGVSAEGR